MFAEACFVETYSQARARFKSLCTERSVSCDEYVHPLRGPDDGTLATQVARLGARNAARLLVLNCGTHGVEGLPGSACLQSFVARGSFDLPDDTAVLLIHLINPWGTAWRRRQTEENVDLNRNFVDFDAALPSNVRYESLRDALTPSQIDGPRWIGSQRRIAEFRLANGESALAEAVFRGQYVDPGGVGFGGLAPSWSNRTLRAILEREAQTAREVAFIDFHTGLGPFGHGTLLSMEAAGSSALATARSWYGESVVALMGNRREMPYDVQGDIGTAVTRLLPAGRVIAVTLEFGTFELDRFLDLQVRDCWLQHHGEPHSPQGEEIRRELQHFFYPTDSAWRESVQARGLEVIDQALTGLVETP